MTPGEAFGKLPRLKRILDVVQRLEHIEIGVLLREEARWCVTVCEQKRVYFARIAHDKGGTNTM